MYFVKPVLFGVYLKFFENYCFSQQKSKICKINKTFTIQFHPIMLFKPQVVIKSFKTLIYHIPSSSG